MPRVVYLFGHAIKVVDLVDDDDSLMGQQDPMQMRIEIRADMSEEAKKSTLLHELMHFAFFFTGRDNERDEEAFCDLGAVTMVSVIRSNPQLLEWLK